MLCHTYRTPCGTGKSNACVMDIIWEELKRNNIDIDKDMLSFYISKCLDEQQRMYDSPNAQRNHIQCAFKLFSKI